MFIFSFLHIVVQGVGNVAGEAKHEQFDYMRVYLVYMYMASRRNGIKTINTCVMVVFPSFCYGRVEGFGIEERGSHHWHYKQKSKQVLQKTYIKTYTKYFLI